MPLILRPRRAPQSVRFAQFPAPLNPVSVRGPWGLFAQFPAPLSPVFVRGPWDCLRSSSRP
ncbi:hypothetical protein GCM10022284_76250 [Streptomyces hundungensis]